MLSFQVRNPDSIPSRVTGVEEGEEDVETDRYGVKIQSQLNFNLDLPWNKITFRPILVFVDTESNFCIISSPLS